MSTTDGLHTPVMFSVDVAASSGTVPPPQIVSEVPKPNVGVMFALTVTVNVVGKAHKPGVGVNVYVPEAWLSTVAGLQLPVTPLSDVEGKAGAVAPLQIVKDVPKPKAGVTFGVTVTLNVAVVAHWPAVGVNVYTPEVVLSITDGLQLPVIPLSEPEGSAGTAAPLHIVSDVPIPNTGVMFGVTVTVNVVVVAHCPGEGVKV